MPIEPDWGVFCLKTPTYCRGGAKTHRSGERGTPRRTLVARPVLRFPSSLFSSFQAPLGVLFFWHSNSVDDEHPKTARKKMSRYTERVDLSSEECQEFWGKTWEMQLGDVYSVTDGSKDNGGAICTAGLTRSVTLATADGDGLVYFIGNTTTRAGGAIYVVLGTRHEIKNAVFDRNQSNRGSAVYNRAGESLTIENSLFQNNISTQSGALASLSECLVANTRFIDNESTGQEENRLLHSGAIYDNLSFGGDAEVADIWGGSNAAG